MTFSFILWCELKNRNLVELGLIGISLLVVGFLAYDSGRRYRDTVEKLMKLVEQSEDRYNRLMLAKDLTDYVVSEPQEEVEEEEDEPELVPLEVLSEDKRKEAIKQYLNEVK